MAQYSIYVGGKYGGSSYPMWRQGIGVNTWVEISGSAMSATPPSINPGRNSGGVSAKMDAWCGLCVDTRSNVVWSLANGGHDDYHGNEVMCFDLGANIPTWVEILPSNSAAEFTVPNNAGYYSSGRPASVHSYYTLQFIEARNRAMRFGATAVSSSGNTFRNVDGFNSNSAVGVNGWDAAGTYPDFPSGIAPGQVTTKNPITEDVFAFIANTAVWKWTQATNAWSQINVGYPPIDPVESASAYDTTRNRAFLLRDSTIHHTFDPTTGSFTSQTLTGTAAAIVVAAAKAVGMIYEPVLDSYIVRLGLVSGGAIYSINASTFAVTEITTSGGAALPATVTISGSPENVYGRFLYLPALDGVAYFPKYSANAWFLRTH